MTKPMKPSADFPLFPHASGSWAKKIAGKLRYFGPWSDPQAALEKYRAFIGETTNLPGPPMADKPARCKTGKPAKPRKGFPLTAHANGQWCKRIKGTVHYFGPWADPQAAEDKWLREKDDLLAGRHPAAASDALTVRQLVNHFLTACKRKQAAQELGRRTVADYATVCERVLKVLGPQRPVESLAPDDFAKLRASFAETHGPVALASDIQRTRVMFNYGVKQFDVRPRYGSSFDKPSRTVLRRERSRRPKKLFLPDEIRSMLPAATVPLKAMILLGVNCAFGNDDCAKLTQDRLNLDEGWHNFPRHKTGIVRQCPLWPETVTALRDAIAARPVAREPALNDRVFLTATGRSWEGSEKNNPISKEMAKLLKKLGIHRTGRTFYALRHTFLTVGKRTRDMFAVHYMMGHAADSDDMDEVYNEDTSEEELIRVCQFVHRWLFGDHAHQKTESRLGLSATSVGGPRARLRLYAAETPEETLQTPCSGEADHQAG